MGSLPPSYISILLQHNINLVLSTYNLQLISIVTWIVDATSPPNNTTSLSNITAAEGDVQELLLLTQSDFICILWHSNKKECIATA